MCNRMYQHTYKIAVQHPLNPMIIVLYKDLCLVTLFWLACPQGPNAAFWEDTCVINFQF